MLWVWFFKCLSLKCSHFKWRAKVSESSVHLTWDYTFYMKHLVSFTWYRPFIHSSIHPSIHSHLLIFVKVMGGGAYPDYHRAIIWTFGIKVVPKSKSQLSPHSWETAKPNYEFCAQNSIWNSRSNLAQLRFIYLFLLLR